MPQELTKDIGHAIKWLAAEFNFLKEFYEDLKKIEEEDLEQQEKDLKKDRLLVRYIGKSERKAGRDVKEIIKEIKEKRREEFSQEELREILKEVEIPANQLLKWGSLYTGKLKKELNTIRTSVALEKKYPKKENQVLVQQEISTLKNELKDLVIWVTALDAALKKGLSFMTKTITVEDLMTEKAPEIAYRILKDLIAGRAELFIYLQLAGNWRTISKTPEGVFMFNHPRGQGDFTAHVPYHGTQLPWIWQADSVYARVYPYTLDWRMKDFDAYLLLEAPLIVIDRSGKLHYASHTISGLKKNFGLVSLIYKMDEKFENAPDNRMNGFSQFNLITTQPNIAKIYDLWREDPLVIYRMLNVWLPDLYNFNRPKKFRKNRSGYLSESKMNFKIVTNKITPKNSVESKVFDEGIINH